MFQFVGLEGFASKFNPRGEREMMGSKKTFRKRFALQKRATFQNMCYKCKVLSFFFSLKSRKP